MDAFKYETDSREDIYIYIYMYIHNRRVEHILLSTQKLWFVILDDTDMIRIGQLLKYEAWGRCYTVRVMMVVATWISKYQLEPAMKAQPVN